MMSRRGPRGVMGPPGDLRGCLGIEDEVEIFTIPCMACEGIMETSGDSTLWFCYGCNRWMDRDKGKLTYSMSDTEAEIVPDGTLLVLNGVEA